jgi:hypothetical protein
MNKSKAEAIAAKLLTYVDGLQYGSVSVSAKVHDGRVVSVSYTTIEQTIEQQQPPPQKAAWNVDP